MKSCPKCLSRATKIFSLNTGLMTCQICDHEFKPSDKHQHRYSIAGSVTTDLERVFTLRCNLCGREKTQRRKMPSRSHTNAPGSTKPRKPIRQVSEKRKSLNAQYSKLRAEFLEKFPQCQVEGCKEAACDVHHRGRRGKNLCRVDLFMAVCRQHHDTIEVNGLWAKSMGYTIPYHLT